MARSTGDTMAEGLQKVLSQLGQMMALPDANPQLLMTLQAGIAGFLKQSATAGGPSGGGNIQLTPGGQPGPLMGNGPGVPTPGLHSATAPDELRRMLGG